VPRSATPFFVAVADDFAYRRRGAASRSHHRLAIFDRYLFRVSSDDLT